MLARSSTSNRQDSKARSLSGFLGVLATLREIFFQSIDDSRDAILDQRSVEVDQQAK